MVRVRTPAGLGLGQPASEVGPRRGPGAVPLTLPQQTPAGHGARSSRDWALGGDADGANGVGLHGRLVQLDEHEVVGVCGVVVVWVLHGECGIDDLTAWFMEGQAVEAQPYGVGAEDQQWG